MNMINYFFLGFSFTFFLELLLQKFIHHPLIKNQTWGNLERLVCVVIWPLAFIIFVTAFIKQYFRK